MTQELSIRETPIPGLLLLSLPVHGDARGWFKENWQREKMVGLGLPDFHPVQNNVSFNEKAGVTRGIHAEPWDKYVSVAAGKIFGAWVDLREGESFGNVFTAELDSSSAIFVPRGVANAFQTLVENTAYSYLVNDHWSPVTEYTFVNLADETLAIEWPITLDKAEISGKDHAHPALADVTPIKPRKTLILGANGQLGRALVARLPAATAWDIEEFDFSDPESYAKVNWRDFDTIINAAAYTQVDQAETEQGRRDAWRLNAHAVALLAQTAVAHDLTLVHVSSDYVFDGMQEVHATDELFAPLGVYGQSKAAGDVAVSVVPKHYIVRTSWVIGDGPNFIKTMQSLAEKGVDSSVVDDQIGCLTYTADLADGIAELLRSKASYGTYNITSGGEPRSWYEIARQAFADAGHDPGRVRATNTEAYAEGRSLAPRPLFSTLAQGRRPSQ